MTRDWSRRNRGGGWPYWCNYAPIIKVKTGDYVVACKEEKLNVFFDDGGGGIEDKIIDQELYDGNENFHKLIDELGVKKTDRWVRLYNTIINFDRLSEQVQKEIFPELVDSYSSNPNITINRLKEKLQDEQSKIFFCRRICRNGDENLYKKSISNLYEGDQLREYFSQTTGCQSYFVDWNIYRDVLRERGRAASEFLKAVGVKSLWPRKETKEKSLSYEEAERKKERIRRENPNAPDFYSPRSGYHYQYVKIEGLIEVLEALDENSWDGDASLSLYVWEMLAAYAKRDDGEDLFQDTFVWFYRCRRFFRCQSELLISLRKYAWLRIDGQKHCVGDTIYREDLLNNKYLHSEDLFRTFGIEKKPDVKALDIIHQLPAEMQEALDLGMQAKRNLEPGENLDELIRLGRQKKQEEANKEIKANNESDNHVPDRIDVGDRPVPLGTHTGETPVEPTTMPIVKLETEVKLEKKDEMQLLIERVEQADRYSYLWFKLLMSLEAQAYSQDEGEEAMVRRTINIDFFRAQPVDGRPELLKLGDPSKYIPTFLEDVDDIPVTFHERGGVKIKVTFDAASVKEDHLLLKGNASAQKYIGRMARGEVRVDKASIDIERPVEIIRNWKSLVDRMGYEDDSSLKDGLRRDTNFIFGPPGTGKTITLAQRIYNLMESEANECRILVLAPTNKACDVLTEKILDLAPEPPLWLWRFVSTMSKRLEDEGTVRGRDADLGTNAKVCVVSTMARYAFDGFQSGKFPLNATDWDYLFIDEASMIPLYQIIFPLYNGQIKNLIVAGDPFQIEPIVRAEGWKGENIYTMINLTDFVQRKTEPVQFTVEPLMTQYRSIPQIGRVFSTYKYGNQLSHHRTVDSHRLLQTGLDETPLNIITFPVKGESLFSARRLFKSNIHVYSVIFTVELLHYMVKNISASQPTMPVRIGVCGPYRAEIQAIEKMFVQNQPPSGIEVLFGTSHGFQGDECDIILVVANPPATGMQRMAERTFINNSNILNVAVSRARDYLYLLMPDSKYAYYSALQELKRLAEIMASQCSNFPSSTIEEKLFGQTDYIETHTFVTSHQAINAYAESSAKYEVRVDENNLDITVST